MYESRDKSSRRVYMLYKQRDEWNLIQFFARRKSQITLESFAIWQGSSSGGIAYIFRKIQNYKLYTATLQARKALPKQQKWTRRSTAIVNFVVTLQDFRHIVMIHNNAAQSSWDETRVVVACYHLLWFMKTISS